jgi:hypothetical protein
LLEALAVEVVAMLLLPKLAVLEHLVKVVRAAHLLQLNMQGVAVVGQGLLV